MTARTPGTLRPTRSFSLDGAVDQPPEERAGALDPRSLESHFDGYEVVDYIRVSLSPVLLREHANGRAGGTS